MFSEPEPKQNAGTHIIKNIRNDRNANYKLSDSISWNHFGRKNICYLMLLMPEKNISGISMMITMAMPSWPMIHGILNGVLRILHLIGPLRKALWSILFFYWGWNCWKGHWSTVFWRRKREITLSNKEKFSNVLIFATGLLSSRQ